MVDKIGDLPADVQTVEAVSYTHLDVYKRQPVYFRVAHHPFFAHVLPACLKLRLHKHNRLAALPQEAVQHGEDEGCLLYTSRCV